MIRAEDRAGYLLVRAGARRVGLPLGQVVAVIEPGVTYPVPAVGAAIRGVTTVRGRILPVVHLGAALERGACPVVVGGTGVVVAVGADRDGGRLCLEVEEAELVLREPGVPVPPGTVLPWATAVASYEGGLVPLLDLSALAGALVDLSLDPELSETRPA